ncbi:MAG: antibiotic biosynthesis monooxygenase [Planctomycetota bacterium]|nr:MAG: antibiotic biosynthesis monooxygenase [Planctomycetota bacterium]
MQPPPGAQYAVIFTSRLQPDAEAKGYGEVAARMAALAREQPGFLGMDSVRGEDGLGTTVSYWRSKESLEAWGKHPQHLAVQRNSQAWYSEYQLRIAVIQEQRFLGPPTHGAVDPHHQQGSKPK